MKIVFSQANADTIGMYEFSKQIPWYSYLPEFNICNTKRRRIFRGQS